MIYDGVRTTAEKLCLSSFLLAIKRHANVSGIANDVLLNEVLEPIVAAGSITNKNGDFLYMNASRTSLLVNRKDDVPISIRAVFEKEGVGDEAERLFGIFLSKRIDDDRMQDLVSDVAEIVGSDNLIPRGQKQALLSKMNSPIEFLGSAYITALKADNRLASGRTIWRRGTGNVGYAIGNLLDYGFKNRSKRKNIVVVPVNTAFDIKVDYAFEGNPYPLVSSETIHGQWLMRLEDSGCNLDTLLKRISVDIAAQGVEPIGCDGCSGKKLEYPIGTVAVVEHSNAIYFLIAVSAFDKLNNAQSAESLIKESVECLLAVYDQRGQGLDMYVPLIGTGRSRANLTHQESFDLIMHVLEENSKNVHGKVTVVVRKEDEGKLTIERRAE